MSRFMLSFSRGKPVALAVNKEGKVLHTIHVTQDQKEPDIEVDNPLELIDKIDVAAVKRALRLGLIETRVLMKAIEAKNSGNLSEGLKRAFDVLEGKANEKLKREINFADDDEVDTLIPVIGRNPEAFDRSIVLIGPSGSGKSFMLKQILVNDPRKRTVVLFSKVQDDPSLKELVYMNELTQKPRLVQIPLFTDADLAELPNDADLNATVTVFDDIDAFTGDRGQYLRDYRDSLLEAGRHKNVSIISTSHILSNYNKTRTILNEAEIVVLFPPANRRSADLFLKDRLGMIKADRDFMIDRSNGSGRFMALRLSNPNVMLHRKGIMLL